jgi:putative toxin-antitoxin system antitoxin component (TIGR02293 family)
VHDGLTTAIMEQAAQALSVSKTEFLTALRLPVSTMTRRLKTGARLSPDESDKVDRVAQAFKRAIELFGNEEMAREWMSTKLLGLGDRTPLELLDSSAGYEMVLNTIGRIAYGAAA